MSRVEKGKVLDKSYSGPVLKEVIRIVQAIRTVPDSGEYAGVPVSVAPIVVEGRAIAAIGVVDVIGTIDVPEVFGNYANVMKQVARPGQADEEEGTLKARDICGGGPGREIRVPISSQAARIAATVIATYCTDAGSDGISPSDEFNAFLMLLPQKQVFRMNARFCRETGNA